MQSNQGTKRKLPNTPGSNRNAKRVKASSARTIIAQSSEKALTKNGDMDVSGFVKAREFEIRALEDSMNASKKALTTRAFQQVPREMRRRTASHNVKKVPKRLRARATKEMKDDNTPIVDSKHRKPTPRMRLRLETARQLKLPKAPSRSQNTSTKEMETGEDDQEKSFAVTAKFPKSKKNTLIEPTVPPSKFRKRQIHKSWLPTHLFHAKHAHITSPKEPLWRFAIPQSPTEKSYRPTHRSGWTRGCVAWDMSYMSTIGLEGVEASLLGLMRGLGISEDQLISKQGLKWRRGTRSWSGWVRDRDAVDVWIAKVRIVWCVAEEIQDSLQATEENENETNKIKGKKKRRVLIRVHPSAFLQLWDELLKIGNMQRPPVSVEDLRFEIGSIEIMGPGAMEALISALRPVPYKDKSGSIEALDQVWSSLIAVNNPASLPADAILGFDVSDPRLHHPPRTVKQPVGMNDEKLLQFLASWPPDSTQTPASLFDRPARLQATRSLPSQKSVNRRKGDAKPGEYPSTIPSDPRIPVLLISSRTENKNGGQGSWTVLLPWKCVLPVWYSIMYYPLSTGGNPRFGGLQEKRQIAFEQGVPWFPGDFPGTKAGWDWELSEREKRKGEWEKRPRGKRIEWDSVDLGNGRKGEIGRGWACDWERLFDGQVIASDLVPKSTSKEILKPNEQNPTEVISKPPFNLHHVPLTQLRIPIPTNSLITTSISLLHRGVPQICARIYRLPTSNPSLRAKWLSLTSPQTRNSKNPHKQRHPNAKSNPRVSDLENSHKSNSDLPPHKNPSELMTSILNPQLHDPRPGLLPQAGSPDYPLVPDEEDLIGFVTTGNFNLGEGRGTGVGCVAVERVLEREAEGKEGGGLEKVRGRVKMLEGWCIIREAGTSVGRLGRWQAI